MTLPIIKTLEDCADFSKTVEPFLPQLYSFPARLLDAIKGDESFLKLYATTNPLISGFAISLILGAVFLVAADINGNYSQVDRFWSLLPTFYIAHFDAWARLAGIPSKRLDLLLLWSTVWSARLTFNYWRKGGYGIGHEDYRWEIIRQHVPKWAFHIFNWTFISFYQSALLYSIAAPAYIILLTSRIEPEITSSDIAYLSIQLGLILTEYIADHQQWVYQSAKKQYQQSSRVPSGFKQADLDRGFITSGLWGRSRHPNFAAEQSIWFFLYQWSCYASKTLYSWAGVGAALLILLFQGSTWFTEYITSGKYPEYRDYQREVGMFVPLGFSSYKGPGVKVPKVIRTSELAKKMEQNKKQK